MEFRLLGPVEAVRHGEPLSLGGAKPRALLAILALHANQVVSRDRLIDALWPERPGGAASHNLDVQVSRLRKAFVGEELLLTRSGGYVLETNPDRIDVRRFERLLDEGKRQNAAGDHADALITLESALGLWRGPALSDLAYEEFARTEIDRLEELRLVTREERIDAELALGRHDTLIAELDALTVTHPLRERLRGQLMLALYRSGRQAEAVRVYAETRRRLVVELGIEPGQALRDLEQAMLRQDPALDLPRPVLATRRRTVATALALVLAGALTAVVVGLAEGGAGGAKALATADSTAFVRVAGGTVAHKVPTRDTTLVRYGAGSLWSVSADGELTRIDPATGHILATIGLGVEPSGMAFGNGSLWVTGRHSPIVFRIDPSVNDVVDRFRLPMRGVVTDLTGEVAFGAGSVWVGHGAFNPGAWVERLDASTGRVQKRFSILAGDVDHVAFGDGALWVASTPSGELRRIDASTNQVAFKRTLQADLCCVAAGAGYAWAASNPDGDVWKLTRNGALLTSIKLGSAVQRLTYADGYVWATLFGKGTLVRIDPTTDAVRRYQVGHSLTGIDVRDGVVAVGVRQSAADAIAGLKGNVVWVGRKAPTLFDSGAATDPAFTAPTWDAPQMQFHYATCGRLLNYPDAEGHAGRRLVPDIADRLPTVSNGGRTYTFRIRKGFRFSPPSNEVVTARSFRDAIERVVSPKFDYVAPESTNIVGVDAYRAGKTAHVSGISARGDTLVIHLRKQDPALPWLAAISCAVPRGTPVVPTGLTTPVASAGPYYLAQHADSFAVLRRNPNYGGSRPQHLDAIVFEFDVSPGEAAAAIENGTLDYFLESQNPTLAPDTAAARAAGTRYRLTPSSSAGTHYFAFNVQRPLFSDIRMRRAVQYALDRRVLAGADGNLIPATRLLGPGEVGYDSRPLYPPAGDLPAARRLSRGRTADAVVYTWDDSPYTDAFNRALQQQLAAIGIRATIVPMVQGDSAAARLAKARRSDLIWGGLNGGSADPAAYMQSLYLPTRDMRELHRVATLQSPERERAADMLAGRIDRESLFAVYGTDAVPELVSRRLGCIVHQPEVAGVDLAALCLR